MSGGHFDYDQYRIRQIWEEINYILEKNKTGETYYTFPKNILAELRKAVKVLQKAEVYSNRIDYLLSGDDGEESFLRRLKEELKELK